MCFLGRIVVLVSLMGLAACATIVKGSSEPIAVTTMPGSHASCTLTNGQGAVDVLAASTATVKKSRTDLDVVCADPASHLAGKIVVQSDVEPWDFGNILTAGLGLGVDWGTGAAYHYPTKVSVPLFDTGLSFERDGAAGAGDGRAAGADCAAYFFDADE